MGFTGLARWVNAPTSGLQQVIDNIVRNHDGIYRGKWLLTVKSLRSTIGASLGPNSQSQQPFVERTMCALTMDENSFVLLEDPAAPTRDHVLAAAPPGQESFFLQSPSHFRTTFLTVRPPGALEQLLAQLKAKWTFVRQSAPGQQQRGQTSGQQLMIEGNIYAIGRDWLVRVGNVILVGGAVKGMLLEAEYLPLPNLRTPVPDETAELLSNLLTSILPSARDAKIVAVTISEAQWEDVLWSREEDELANPAKKKEAEKKEGVDDLYVYGMEDIPDKKPGDWSGVDRDRRSAYVIIGALKSEGIL